MIATEELHSMLVWYIANLQLINWKRGLFWVSSNGFH